VTCVPFKKPFPSCHIHVTVNGGRNLIRFGGEMMKQESVTYAYKQVHLEVILE